jgi:hypothetical protein
LITCPLTRSHSEKDANCCGATTGVLARLRLLHIIVLKITPNIVLFIVFQLSLIIV